MKNQQVAEEHMIVLLFVRLIQLTILQTQKKLRYGEMKQRLMELRSQDGSGLRKFIKSVGNGELLYLDKLLNRERKAVVEESVYLPAMAMI